MKRRTLLIYGGLAALASTGAEAETGSGAGAGAKELRSIRADGVVFDWRHKRNRLFARMEAPTTGWVAVGFNTETTLAGTRFVIATGSGPDMHAEEHVAEPPNHRRVEELGLTPAVADLALEIEDGKSRLSFSLPHRFADTPTPVLSPGQKSFLMLAWSLAPDFDHHSAWRRHFETTL